MRKFDNKFYRRGEVINTALKAILLESKAVMFGKGYIVLALIPRLSQGEYVTWFMTEEKNTVDGHYSFSLQDSLDDFEARN